MAGEEVAAKDDYLLDAQNIYSLYKGVEGSPNVVALRGMNLRMKPGEMVSVVGPSGAGKSTLLRILGGLQAPSAGHVFYRNMDITKLSEGQLVPFRRRTVGYVFQEGNLLPTITALQNVIQSLRFAGRPVSEARERAVKLMGLLGMTGRMNAMPPHLSGGEKQRVAIARALANEPEIILADEPTGNLDYANAENVMGMLKDLRSELNTACLVVTHSKHIASFTDRSVELRDGKMIGQHGADLDIEELSGSRQVFISKDGALALPPEILPAVTAFGELWDIRVRTDERGIPTIIGTPANGGMVNGQNGARVVCPVCKAAVADSDFHCKSCGAKLKA